MERKPSGFYFRGDSLVLYRRLWKLLFDNLTLTSTIHALIRDIVQKANPKQENLLKMKTSIQAIGLEEKNLIRENLEHRLRFYAAAQEI